MILKPKVVLLTKDHKKAELVLNLCSVKMLDLVIVDLGLEQLLKIPNGVTLTIVSPQLGDYSTLSNAANLGALQARHDFILVSDNTINIIEKIDYILSVGSKIPKLGALYLDSKGLPGTHPSRWVSFFGTLYNYKAYTLTGRFDSSIRDLSLVASEWATRAQQKGWTIVTTYLDLPILENLKDTVLSEVKFLNESSVLDTKDEELLAPTLNPEEMKPWTGKVRVKPWMNKATISIAHRGDKLHQLKLILDLWRAQTVKPFLEIRDTGSPTKLLPDLLSLEAPDLEIHFSRWRGLANYYDYQSLACEHALSDCRTPYLVLTHNDVFPIHQTLLEELISQCDKNQPVVGYQMYPRKGMPYEGMVSHTLTIIHVETMDRLRINWNTRWLRTCSSNLTKESRGWPSAEVAFNLMLHNAGVKPRIIGEDVPMERQITPHFDHVGSYVTTQLYYINDQPRAGADLNSATLDAEQRLAKWAGL